MLIIDSIILGIVEGLTEFLPISSTAHLAMTAKILGLAQTDFVKTFEISIQLGAILAVIFFFRNNILNQRALMKKVIVAFIPTGVIGFALYKLIKDVFLENYLVMIWALIIGGLILIIFEKTRKSQNNQKTLDTLSYYDAFRIGVFQAVSVIPGVSRAGATIIGGLFLGVEKKSIVEFSFLLAIPTMLAATLYDIYKNAGMFSQSEINPLVIGFVVAFVSALIAVKFFISYISKNSFTLFGIYRIIIGLLFFLIFIM